MEHKVEGSQAMFDTILRRRTVHRFEKREIPNETIEQLLQTAMFAPTRLGKRPWHFVVITDTEMKRKLTQALAISDEFAGAPVFVTVLAERLSSEWDLDAAAATENLLIAATALGLGSAWLGGRHAAGAVDASRTFSELAKVPKEVELVSVVALGYPAEEIMPRSQTEAYEQHRVHFERWGNTKG